MAKVVPIGNTDRLVRSLHYHGWNYEIWTWKNEHINEYFDPRFPYTIKARTFAEAVREDLIALCGWTVLRGL